VLYPVLASRTLHMVATDLDGTIIPHGQGVSARTRAALQACTRAGARVVFVTGRPPRWLTPVAQATGHKGFANALTDRSPWILNPTRSSHFTQSPTK
jgi:ribonucleotide monophosphatase NagD (HAD superfamily)